MSIDVFTATMLALTLAAGWSVDCRHGSAVPTHAACCPRCTYPSRYVLTTGIEVRLICGSCGHSYRSGDGFLGVSAGAGEVGRGRVDDMDIQTNEKEAATQ